MGCCVLYYISRPPKNPTWRQRRLRCEAQSVVEKAYFRQGVALQYLGRHADALAAFASGLAQDPKSLQLLVGMIEAAMKSPLRESLEPTYQQLQKMKLDKSPFVVVSVIGQELLTASHHTGLCCGAGGRFEDRHVQPEATRLRLLSPQQRPLVPGQHREEHWLHAAGLGGRQDLSLTHDWAEQLEIRSCGSQVERRDLRFTLALSVGPLCQAEIIRLSPLTLWSIEINTTSCQGSCSTVENLERPLSLLRVHWHVGDIDVVHHMAVQAVAVG
ncbi:Tetratricopeptide repeat protein 28 [Collichthys lucidus]|uniref:Tetratricopeptide repeat protein 28 n=1 Tax=Collichthys lucidus TaxID=240159 RepID=A0A4U5UYN1_COLLU|nr:Tetratricopeptide repeat protein 28 [Collichthys lucidus]